MVDNDSLSMENNLFSLTLATKTSSKETFVKLSKEKKDKIIKAAKKEFARVPFEQTSIKNIVEDADIARGSFYQYFESKEDLLRVYFKYTF